MSRQNPVDQVLEELVGKYRKELGLFLLSIIVLGGFTLSILFSRTQQKQPVEVKEMGKSLSAEVSVSPAKLSKILVDVSGAVNQAGVYELEEGSRVKSALDAAGGLSDQADLDFVAREINLVQELVDGQKVYIPAKEEVRAEVAGACQLGVIGGGNSGAAALSSGSAKSTAPVGGKININTASQDELESLPGIGAVKAAAVIAYRKEHGNFKTIEEIMKVSGIAEGIFAKIKDRIAVHGQ